MQIVIVTGISGAGKTNALRCLEDLGFYCVDNLPPMLIPKFVEICAKSSGKIDKAALVIDIRGGDMFSDAVKAIEEIERYKPKILFLDAKDPVIIKRYKETRRAHPLAGDGKIINGIAKEREVLGAIRQKATHVINTSNLLTKQLKEKIIDIFVDSAEYEGIIIDVMSFGFKYGIPEDADLVFDVRFLPNPFYIEELKSHTGLDKEVSDYVKSWKQTSEFTEKLLDMIDFLIPHYIEEGKAQLVIAIGCTGGKHRSVTLAEDLYNHLKEAKHRTIKHHRDIQKY